ncbi:MAG: amidohydrolase family protein [Candidatus Binatia bacterium]
MARKYRYFSADSHFESLPESWTHRVPEKYRDRAPRRIKLADGRDAILEEGQPLEYRGTSLFAGKSIEEFNPVHLNFASSVGAGPPQQRLKEQDADGIDGELLFASEARNPKIKDRDAFLAIVKAFNDYFIEEYCALDPQRLIGVAVMPDIGVKENIAEIKRCKDKGFKAVRLHTYPSGKSTPTPEDDKFWAVALDLDMPITIHTSFPRRTDERDVYLMQYPREPEGEERPFDFLQRVARHGIYHCGAVEAAQLIFTGVFDRFPRLQIFWAENNIGWIPYFYQQMDQTYKVNYSWAERLLGLKRLSRLPSEYLRDHAHWGFFDDPIGVQLRHLVGVERIMWSTDFPHIVTRWPRSLDLVEEQFTGVPAHERQAMLAGNAVKFFHLDAG